MKNRGSGVPEVHSYALRNAPRRRVSQAVSQSLRHSASLSVASFMWNAVHMAGEFY